MKRLPSMIFGAAVLGCLLVFSSCCVGGGGQLEASEVAPLLEIVADDFEEYLDAGIGPDGEPLTATELFSRRGSVVTLRNAFLTAQGLERIPLPMLPGLEPLEPAVEPVPEPDPDLTTR